MMDGKGAEYGFDEEKRRAEPIDAFLTARWKLEKISIFWIWSAVLLKIYIYIISPLPFQFFLCFFILKIIFKQ